MLTEKKPVHRLLFFTSLLMLIIAIPMMIFTFDMVYTASPHDVPGDGLASLGMLVGAGAYVYSMVVAIVGLVYYRKPYRHHWCRKVAWVLVLLLGIAFVLARAYFLIAMTPLVMLLSLYLWGARKR